jgi:hypothetical protein
MTHLCTLNISYGQKKCRKSNCQFDSRPLKVRNCLDLLACKWCARYCWKFFDDGYNFALTLSSIKGMHKKLWASKVARNLISRISRLQLGSPETKWHLGASLVARHKKYYKGESSGFPPKSKPWWILWICVCSWFIRAPKVFQLCTN